MKFDKHFPTERLKPFVKYFVISENESQHQYTVLPTPGLVIGFQYRGKIAVINGNTQTELKPAGITGISGSYRIFNSYAHTATLLVYFTETGFSHFSSTPAHELFNVSISLDHIFNHTAVTELEERLGSARDDRQRLHCVEQFLLSQLRDRHADKLIAEAVRLIYDSKGTLRIRDLTRKLLISQSPFEKRFRKIVGTTPKKFSSIIRLNAVVDQMNRPASLLDICYENNFFDQAHFSKDFKQFTGVTPENFKRT